MTKLVMKLDDECIIVNENKYSLKKILGEDKWSLYVESPEEIKDLVRLRVRLDLYAIEIGFARLEKLFDKVKKNEGSK